jgi:hypothetical protein
VTPLFPEFAGGHFGKVQEQIAYRKRPSDLMDKKQTKEHAERAGGSADIAAN